MRIGAHAQIWVAPFTGRDLDLLEHIRALGFEAVDINVPELPPPFSPAELRARLERTSLQASMGAYVNAARDITSADDAIRRAGRDFLTAACRLCGEVGARNFIGPFHSELRRQRWEPPAARAERWKRGVESLAAVAEEAERADARLGIEVLNRYESDFLTTTADGVRLCQAVGHPRMGLLLDTFHMNMEERDLGEAIRSARGFITHFHACENDRGAPGSGHVDWAEVRDALRDVGYQGICTIESYNPDLPVLAERTAFWRPLAQSPDDLAQQGLAFLRSLFA